MFCWLRDRLFLLFVKSNGVVGAQESLYLVTFRRCRNSRFREELDETLECRADISPRIARSSSGPSRLRSGRLRFCQTLQNMEPNLSSPKKEEFGYDF